MGNQYDKVPNVVSDDDDANGETSEFQRGKEIMKEEIKNIVSHALIYVKNTTRTQVGLTIQLLHPMALKEYDPDFKQLKTELEAKCPGWTFESFEMVRSAGSSHAMLLSYRGKHAAQVAIEEIATWATKCAQVRPWISETKLFEYDVKIATETLRGMNLEQCVNELIQGDARAHVTVLESGKMRLEARLVRKDSKHTGIAI